MKTRARIVSGLAALAALFLAPIVEASLTRATSLEAHEVPALTLATSAPEFSEFSLFVGDELTRDLGGPRARAGGFHPLAAVSLLSKDGAEAPLVSADELIYPKTRYRVFDFLGAPLIGVQRELSLELQWGSRQFGLKTSEGIGIWLSQDPLGDVDSPNLYGFVGMRPHEKTDPLGLQAAPSPYCQPGAIADPDLASWACGATGMPSGGSVPAPAPVLSPVPSPSLWQRVTGIKGRVQQWAHDFWKRPEQKPRPPEVAEVGLDLYDESVERGYRDMGDITAFGAGVIVEWAEWEIGGKLVRVGLDKAGRVISKTELGSAASGARGPYREVKGHHVHAKAGFRGNVGYSPSEGFSISQEYMKSRGWSHETMSAEQHRLFRELAKDGRANTMQEHTRIAVESLMKGGATEGEARALVADSLRDLRSRGVRQPTDMPWSP